MSPMLKRWRFLIVAGLALLGLVGVGAAQTNISNSPNWFSTCPRIAVDPAGNVHAVWAEFYTMNGGYPASGDAFYSKLNAVTQQWSTPINLSNSGQCYSGEWYVVGIDTDGSGNVYVVYIDRPKIKLRIFSGGSWSAPFEVGSSPSTDIDSARVAVDAAGNIFVSWCDSGYRVVYSRARVGGTWESVATLTYPGSVSKFPEISVGANQVYCVFMDNHFTVSFYAAVYVHRAKTFGAAWSSSQRMTSAGNWEEHPAVRVDAADVAHVIFTPYYDSTASRDVRYVEGTSGGFSAPVVLGTQGNVHYPALAVRGGNVYTCWQSYGVHYRNRPGGTWGAENAVPSSSCYALTDVATSPLQDKIYYVWDSSGGDIYCGVIIQYVAPAESSDQAVGDFDGDGRDEVAVDFGANGIWLADDSGWSQISANNPERLLAMDVQGDHIDEIIGDFGASGLWIWVNNAWHIISSRNADFFVAGNIDGKGGEELIVDFGSIGLWTWNGYNWTQLSGAKSNSLVAADVDGDGSAEVASGFGALGLWLWKGGSWSQLSGLAPQTMVAGNADGSGGEELIADFGAVGVWVRNAGNWIKVSPADADALLIADVNGDGIKEFLGDFGALGLYLWINNQWVKLSPCNPERVIAADVDGDGLDEVVGDFGTLGLYVWDGTGWTQISAMNPENIQAGDADGDGKKEILSDFGLLGLWGWCDGTWYLLSSLNPD
jgi:hypothetical protein